MADFDYYGIGNKDEAEKIVKGKKCPKCGGKMVEKPRSIHRDEVKPGSYVPFECEKCGYVAEVLQEIYDQFPPS